MTAPQKVELTSLAEAPGEWFAGFDSEAEARTRAEKSGKGFYYFLPKNHTYYVAAKPREGTVTK